MSDVAALDGDGPIAATSLADTVLERLRTAIQTGALRPGDRLVERTLAGQLGVSHIPVREALARLAEEGVVERLPRRGARVAVLTARQLDEVSTLRIVLEQFVVRRVQEAWTPAVDAELRALVSEMLAAAEAGDAATVGRLDQEFHERLWLLADHALLNELAAQFRRRIAGFLRQATGALSTDGLRTHAEMHGELLDAIASGHRARAEEEMERHISLAAARIRAALVAEAHDA